LPDDDKFTQRLRQIDEKVRGDHFYLEPGDQVYHWLEYTSGRNYSFGNNQFIQNIKKSPTRPAGELYYKNRDIESAGGSRQARSFLCHAPKPKSIPSTTIG
jgi:hypothetical protein